MNKPMPPEDTLQCSFCGYTAKKSEYKHICWFGILLAAIMLLIPGSMILMLIYRIFKLW
jgi:hypothetical protein